jgi:hypothetical protein
MPARARTSGGEELHGRADQQVGRQLRSLRVELARRFDGGGDDEQQEPPEGRAIGAAGRARQERDARETHGHGGHGRAPEALAVNEPEDDDPQRHGGDDQRGQPGGHLLLGQRQQADVAEDDGSDHARSQELPATQREARSSASCENQRSQ